MKNKILKHFEMELWEAEQDVRECKMILGEVKKIFKSKYKKAIDRLVKSYIHYRSSK